MKSWMKNHRTQGNNQIKSATLINDLMIITSGRFNPKIHVRCDILLVLTETGEKSP